MVAIVNEFRIPVSFLSAFLSYDGDHGLPPRPLLDCGMDPISPGYGEGLFVVVRATKAT
jgi:hypothetical protein